MFCRQSLTAGQANCRANGKVVYMFLISASTHISFFSTARQISRLETAYLPTEIILNVEKFL